MNMHTTLTPGGIPRPLPAPTLADGRATRRPADVIDNHIGQSIRRRRKAQHVTQGELAEHLGVTFQQVQKYEKGANRVSASMLLRIAERLEAPLGYFVAGLEADTDTDGAPSRPAEQLIDQLLATAGGLELAQAFVALPRAMRQPVLAVAQSWVRHLAASEGATQ